MTSSVATDQTNVFVTVRLITDADGTPATGVVAATGGHQIQYRRENSAVVTDGGSAADLASLTTAHTDWEFIHIYDGYYTVAIPDAAFIAGAGSVLINMIATGISCVSEKVIIGPLKYNGQASSVTSTTTTFPAGTIPKKGDEIYVVDGTGIRQTRLVLSVTGEVATHLAWDINISATVSTIILIPGDETVADGGIRMDATISSRSALTSGNIETACDASLVTYDAPTRAEATSDKDEVLALLPSALVNGKMDSNVARINDIAVIGAGTALDKWRA